MLTAADFYIRNCRLEESLRPISGVYRRGDGGIPEAAGAK
jgi:hypothetical protein